MLLDITRSFVENKDGSFDHFISASEEEKNMFSSNMPLIRPLELKTYLKVGKKNTHYLLIYLFNAFYVNVFSHTNEMKTYQIVVCFKG